MVNLPVLANGVGDGLLVMVGVKEGVLVGVIVGVFVGVPFNAGSVAIPGELASNGGGVDVVSAAPQAFNNRIMTRRLPIQATFRLMVFTKNLPFLLAMIRLINTNFNSIKDLAERIRFQLLAFAQMQAEHLWCIVEGQDSSWASQTRETRA